MLNKDFITDLFFDLDHTLWDFEKNSFLTFKKIFDKLNINLSVEDFIQEYRPINHLMWAKYRKNLISQEELRYVRLEKTFALMKYDIDSKKISDISDLYIKYLSTFPHLFPGTIDLLRNLHKRYNLHIITNGFKKIQDKKLKSSRILGFFKNIFTSEDIGYKKPHPLIFKKALESSSTSPHSALMIGDNLEVDILGSLNSGMQAIHFNSNNEPLHDHCIIINDIDEILNFL